MTHGHIVFYDWDGENRTDPINCHTYHDGFSQEAIDDLLDLPFDIFKKQKKAWENYWSIPQDTEMLRRGYWFYNMQMDFLIRDYYENSKKKTREEVYKSWISMIPLRSGTLAFAQWFCAYRFNCWGIEAQEQESTNFNVLCTNERLNSYTIEFNMEDFYDDDEEAIQEYIESLTEQINKINKLIPNEKMHDCHCSITRIGNMLMIRVPFDAIFCELLWQDYQRFYQLADENRLAEDPYLYAAYKEIMAINEKANARN